SVRPLLDPAEEIESRNKCLGVVLKLHRKIRILRWSFRTTPKHLFRLSISSAGSKRGRTELSASIDRFYPTLAQESHMQKRSSNDVNQIAASVLAEVTRAALRQASTDAPAGPAQDEIP